MSPRKRSKPSKVAKAVKAAKPARKAVKQAKKTTGAKKAAVRKSAKKAPAKKAPVIKAQAKKAPAKKAGARKQQKPVLDASRRRALMAAVAALDKKALDLTVLHMTELVTYTDYFVICTGNSRPHVQAVAESVEEALHKAGARPIGIEGKGAGHWVLIDYGDVVVHVMDPDARQYYGLEKLWLDAPRVSIDADQAFVGGQDEGAVGCGCG